MSWKDMFDAFCDAVTPEKKSKKKQSGSIARNCAYAAWILAFLILIFLFFHFQKDVV